MWVILLALQCAVAMASQSFYICSLNNIDYYSNTIPSPISITSNWKLESTYGYTPSCEPYHYRNSGMYHALLGYKAYCKNTNGLFQLVDTSSVQDLSTIFIPRQLYKKTGIYTSPVEHQQISSVKVCIHKGSIHNRRSNNKFIHNRNIYNKIRNHRISRRNHRISRRNHRILRRYQFTQNQPPFGYRPYNEFEPYKQYTNRNYFNENNSPVENKPIQITIYNQHSFLQPKSTIIPTNLIKNIPIPSVPSSSTYKNIPVPSTSSSTYKKIPVPSSYKKIQVPSTSNYKKILVQSSSSYKMIPVPSTSISNYKKIPVQSTSSSSYKKIPVQSSSSYKKIPVQSSSRYKKIPVQSTSSSSYKNIPVQSTSSSSYKKIPVQSTSTSNYKKIRSNQVNLINKGGYKRKSNSIPKNRKKFIRKKIKEIRNQFKNAKTTADHKKIQNQIRQLRRKLKKENRRL